MKWKITAQNLAERLAQEQGISKRAADTFVRAFVDSILEGLRADDLVKVNGLGTFKAVSMGSRESVDVTTGERITIPSYRKLSFTPADEVTTALTTQLAQRVAETGGPGQDGDKASAPADETDEPADIIDEKSDFDAIDELIATPESEAQPADMAAPSAPQKPSGAEQRTEPAPSPEPEVPTVGTEESEPAEPQPTEETPHDTAVPEKSEDEHAKAQNETVEEVPAFVAQARKEHQHRHHHHHHHHHKRQIGKIAGTCVLLLAAAAVLFLCFYITPKNNYQKSADLEETTESVPTETPQAAAPAEKKTAETTLDKSKTENPAKPEEQAKQQTQPKPQAQTQSAKQSPATQPQAKPQATQPQAKSPATQPQAKPQATQPQAKSPATQPQAKSQAKSHVAQSQTKAKPAKRPKTYVLQKGQSLTDVSVMFYGTKDSTRAIIRANKFKNPDNIYVGTEIKLP